MTENLGLRVHDTTPPCTALQLSHVIQRERSDRRIPLLVCTGNDNGSENLLSFSRSARESPKWFHRGNDDVLRCPSLGDPRFARMTEKDTTLTRPRIVALPLTVGFHGVLAHPSE